MAYRLWQEIDDEATLPSALAYLFAPFAGLNTQTDYTDTTLTYVATLYRDNKLELWKRQVQNTYEKIKELSVQAPTSFRLKNSRLVYAEGDSLLQVIKLTETQKVTPLLQKLFPVGKSRYRLLTTNSLRSNGRGLKGLVTSAPKASLSPRGKWLITLDSINLAHLYNLDDSAREHPFFQDYANFIQEIDLFSLDMAVFSATDDFLLIKHASQKTYYLFDLRSQSAPTIYENTVQGVFSPTGRYAVLESENGQLMIIDVANRLVCFSGPSPGITDMAFTRQNASLVVVTDQNLVSQENDLLLRAITINTIDLNNQP